MALHVWLRQEPHFYLKLTSCWICCVQQLIHLCAHVLLIDDIPTRFDGVSIDKIKSYISGLFNLSLNTGGWSRIPLSVTLHVFNVSTH